MKKYFTVYLSSDGEMRHLNKVTFEAENVEVGGPVKYDKYFRKYPLYIDGLCLKFDEYVIRIECNGKLYYKLHK